MSTYRYADGNGNRYVITPSQLSYDPIKAEESSSGVYQGGKPKTVRLTKDEYAAIRSAFETAMAATANHITNRIKMSGAITSPDQKNYLLAPGCAEMTELESLLRQTMDGR